MVTGDADRSLHQAAVTAGADGVLLVDVHHAAALEAEKYLRGLEK